jgi:hypothetical protein
MKNTLASLGVLMATGLSQVRSLIYIFVVSWLLASAVFAQVNNNWTGNAGNTNWNDPGNWSLFTVPTYAHNVVMTNGRSFYPVLVGGSHFCNNLTIQNAASFTMNDGQLFIQGNWTRNGAGSAVFNGGQVHFVPINGNTVNIQGATTFHSIEVNGDGRVDLRNTTTVQKDVILTAGTLAAGQVSTVGQSLIVRGNWFSNGGFFDPLLATVTFDGNTDAQITGPSINGTTFYNVTLQKTSGLDALVQSQYCLIQNRLQITTGEWHVNDVPGVDLNVRENIRINNNAALYLDNPANTPGLEVQIGGELWDRNTGTLSRNVLLNTARGLNFRDRFAQITFNGTNPVVNQIVRGEANVVAQQVSNNMTAGITLPTVVVNTASKVVLSNLGQGAWIRGNCFVQGGTFSLNGRRLIYGTGLTAPNAGTFRAEGTGVIELDGGAALLMRTVNAEGPILTTLGAGTIRMVGTSLSNVCRITRDGNSGNYYRFRIEAGGRLEARYYSITLIHETGLTLMPGSTLAPEPLNLSDGVFNETNTKALVTYLNLRNDFIGTDTIRNVTFNYTNIVRNVTRLPSTTGTYVFVNSGGSRSGPQFEQDPADPTPPPSRTMPNLGGRIHWLSQGQTCFWTGAVSNVWHDDGNWSPRVPLAIDNAVIPTVASNRYPRLFGDASVFNLTIDANLAAALDSVLRLNNQTLTVNGSLLRNAGNGAVYATGTSRLNINLAFNFPSANRFFAATGSLTTFFGLTTLDNAYTFGDIRIVGNVLLTNDAINMTVQNVLLSSGSLQFINSDFNLIVNGSWTVDEGTFDSSGGRVHFRSLTTSAKTIRSRGQVFGTLLFQPNTGGSCTYTLEDALTATSIGSGTATNGSSLVMVGANNARPTLRSNGQDIFVNNVILNGGTAGVDLNAQLIVENGGTFAIGAGYSLQIAGSRRPLLAFLGTASNRVTVTRQGTTGEYSFALGTVSCSLQVAFTDFRHMNSNGIDVRAAQINTPSADFDNCSFSNLSGYAGPLLQLPNVALGPIEDVRFFTSALPIPGTFFNVFRSAAGSGTVSFVNATGNLSGPIYERDPVGTTNPGNIIWNSTAVYWGNFASGTWHELPSKWVDQNGITVPPPTALNNVILDHRFCPGPYTVTADLPVTECANLTLNAGFVHPITLDMTGSNFNIFGFFETTTPLDKVRAAATITCTGSWTMSQGVFEPQPMQLVRFTGAGATITQGSVNWFERLKFNSLGSTFMLNDELKIKNRLTVAAGILDVSSANYTLTLDGADFFVLPSGFVQHRQSVLNLTGSTSQKFKIEPRITFHEIILQKSGGAVELESDLLVGNGIIFLLSNKANIVTDTHTVRMAYQAYSIGSLDDGNNGFVEGRMSYTYNDENSPETYLFTTGKGGDYLPLTLDVKTIGLPTEIVVEQFNAAPAARILPVAPDSIVGVTGAHYWRVKPVEQTSVAEAWMTIRYNADDVAAMFPLSYENLRILKAGETDTAWQNLSPGATVFGDYGGGFVSTTIPFTTFSDFGFGASYDIPFPVELISFHGRFEPLKQQVHLDWLVAREKLVSGYAVQRLDAHTGAVTWVAKVPANQQVAGNLAKPEIFYATPDSGLVVPGATYIYRLFEVSVAGKLTYLAQTEVTIPDHESVRVDIYPNPVQSELNCRWLQANMAACRMELYTSVGQLVQRVEFGELESGYQAVKLDVSQLPAGVYTWKLITGAQHNATGTLLKR